MNDEGRVIVLLDPINTGWISHIPDFTAQKDKLILAVHPFAEDLLIEPKGLYNYVVPVLTELFVDQPAYGKYVGGCFGADFRGYDRTKPQKKLHLAKKLPMPAMLRNQLQQMLYCSVHCPTHTSQGKQMQFWRVRKMKEAFPRTRKH